MNAGEQRSLAETPTWSVATVTTVMVAVCFVVQRSIYQFGKWLRRTKRKALLASLEKIKEELMLLGLISLLLGQCARWISEICVKSSLFTSRFYPCSQGDFAITEDISHIGSSNLSWTGLRRRWLQMPPNNCSKGYEPFVSYESLKQLHRFLFILGITHVSYSCITVVFSMIKIYSWRKWENQANPLSNEYLEGIFISDLHSTCPKYYLSPSRRTAIRMLQKFKIERITNNDRDIRRKYFPFHMSFASCANSRAQFESPITWLFVWVLLLYFLLDPFGSYALEPQSLPINLEVLLEKSNSGGYHKLPHSYNFHRYMVRSMEDEFHGIVGISWPLWIYAITCICVNIHGLNVYFWLSFIPFILVMLVGTKLQHVVAQLALEIEEATGPFAGSQLKPRDDLFWFGKPSILLWLIQFISFQNSFEMASFIWSLWGIKKRQCFMKNHLMIIIRLTSGILAQFWCSYSTVPVNVIVTQMGSRFKKALISESVRESLHSWCKRVKEKSKRDGTARSVCSLDTTLDDIDEEITVVTGGTLSRSSSSVTRRSVSSKQQDEIRGAESQAEYETSDQPPLDSTSQLPHISSSTRRETFSRVSDQHAESENDASDDEGW